ncbi:serine protease inhibitor 42Dd-like [Scaptodrosophila lebanonensis]|uniref:Serine protease inhibitor 42Dd-like n=1 Tax=Drosophila lebanonensis TaxID=7225 RepID=A0A6J2THW3_DROLE|nr:serine protease inhibitor 42Dd-like [Scaptodrosophila lebanonensis]
MTACKNILILSLCAFAVQGNLFASRLYREIAGTVDSDRNIVISPAALRNALAAIFGATQGHTAAILKDALQLEGSTLAEALAALHIPKVSKAQSALMMRFANRLFLPGELDVLGSYEELIFRPLNMDVRIIDYSDSAIAETTINTFLEQNTENKICKIMMPKSGEKANKLMLVSAAYFKAQSTHLYGKSFQMPFFYDTTKQIQVMGFKQKEIFRFGYLQNLRVSGVELPFKDTNLTMLILLPNDYTANLTQIENELVNYDLRNISHKFNMQTVFVTLPIFKVDFDIQLQGVFENMGLGSLFDGSASFAGMTTGKGRSLQLSDVLHKGYIEFNENGVEVAAGDLATQKHRSFQSFNPAIYFTANHPFIFAIKDATRVYFMGRIVRPTVIDSVELQSMKS